MRRFHLHISVPSIDESVAFYTRLFACPPTVLRNDYAKWLLDEPRVNFAISQRGAQAGINHLGLQFDSGEELDELQQRMSAARVPTRAEVAAPCCYSEADKHWITDPTGIAWEAFHTLKDIPIFGVDSGPSLPAPATRRAFPVKVAAVAQCCPGTSSQAPQDKDPGIAAAKAAG